VPAPEGTAAQSGVREVAKKKPVQPASPPPAYPDPFDLATLEIVTHLHDDALSSASAPTPVPFVAHERTERKKNRRPSRDPKIDRLIEEAAREAGEGIGSTLRFVHRLDCDGVPPPAGYKSWEEANKADPSGSSIRGHKLRALARIRARKPAR
jgi:hypothetical protein